MIAAYGSIDSVDPAQATTVIALQLISALGDPLYAIDGQGAIQPKLARALPTLSDDGLTATIPLRQGFSSTTAPPLMPTPWPSACGAFWPLENSVT